MALFAASRSSGLAKSLFSRQAPVLATRALRTTVPRPSSVPSVVTDDGKMVPVDKYFDGESLVAHQARVRHSDPANRTFNYTMLGKGGRVIFAHLNHASRPEHLLCCAATSL